MTQNKKKPNKGQLNTVADIRVSRGGHYIKTVIITIFQVSKKLRYKDGIQKKTQIEFLEIKTTTSEMQNTLMGLIDLTL